jgi:hypothetical protein
MAHTLSLELTKENILTLIFCFYCFYKITQFLILQYNKLVIFYGTLKYFFSSLMYLVSIGKHYLTQRSNIDAINFKKEQQNAQRIVFLHHLNDAEKYTHHKEQNTKHEKTI